MPIPREIIDNTAGNKLVDFLNEALKERCNRDVDIATAFFNITAFSMISENLSGVRKFRLLLGKTPEMPQNRTLGDFLLDEMKSEIEGFELKRSPRIS